MTVASPKPHIATPPPGRSIANRVLLLGGESRMMLPIVRSLGRRGLEVHVGWCASNEPVLRSRYVHTVHDLARWSPDSDDWLHDIQALVSRADFDLIIPATEAALVPLHHARDHLPADGRFYLLNECSFATFFDKGRTHTLAESLSIPVPKGTILRPSEPWRRRVAGWRFPLAVKPLCSVDPTDVRAKRFVRRAESVEELETCLAMMTQDEGVIVEEWFEGRGVGVEFLANRGQILFAFQHERLHETVGYGSTYRRSTALAPKLLDAVKRLLAAVDYTGVGMAEFRCDPKTGEFVLLEVNARFWGSLPLAAAAGADFPAYLYDLIVHQRRSFPSSYRTGVRCRDLLNDARWTWRALRGRNDGAMMSADFDGWQMNRTSRARVVADLVRMLLIFPDRTDTFSWHDPAPAAAEAMSVLRMIGRRRPGWMPA